MSSFSLTLSLFYLKKKTFPLLHKRDQVSVLTTVLLSTASLENQFGVVKKICTKHVQVNLPGNRYETNLNKDTY